MSQQMNREPTLSIWQDLSRNASEVFNPLLKDFGISFFSYTKLFANGQMYRICNNEDWSSIYYQKDFYNSSAYFQSFAQETPLQQIRRYLWIARPNQPLYQEARQHNIWNGICQCYRDTDYIEITSFAGELNDEHLNNFYLNNNSLVYDLSKHIYDYETQVLDAKKSEILFDTVNTFPNSGRPENQIPDEEQKAKDVLALLK